MSVSTSSGLATRFSPFPSAKVANPSRAVLHVLPIAPHSDERLVFPLTGLAPGAPTSTIALPEEGYEVSYLSLSFGRQAVVVVPHLFVHANLRYSLPCQWRCGPPPANNT